MQIAIIILVIVCLLMQLFVIAVLYGRNPAKERNALQELLRNMQKEEQKLRKEQAAGTNETIQLSMQVDVHAARDRLTADGTAPDTK